MSQPVKLIIGASGAVGLPTIRHLVAVGAHVRALTSSEQSAARLRSMGVSETVVGDFRSRDDLRCACDRIEAMLYTPPRFTEDEADIGFGVVAAAKTVGVKRFVLTSVFHSQLTRLPHHRNKLRMEEAVVESGLPFVILQPAMFMQNLRIEWPTIEAEGVYYRPYSPDRKQALIDTDDLGEAAACALLSPALEGATLELAGPDSLTQHEMAAIIAGLTGRSVIAKMREPSNWAEWARGCGWLPWAVDTYLAMCAHYHEHGYAGSNPLTLSAILGRAPTGYRSFIERFLAERAKAV